MVQNPDGSFTLTTNGLHELEWEIETLYGTQRSSWRGLNINVTLNKPLPTITINSYNTDPTYEGITVTASVTNGSLNQTEYTFTENGSFTFVATNDVGTVSRGIFHGEFLGIPRAPRVGGIFLAAELVVDIAHDALDLVVVHHPQGQVERVGADVDQRAAALFVLIEEDAPGGNGTTTDGMRLGVVDFAQFAVLAQLLEVQGIGTLAVLVADGEHFAGALRGIDHLLGLGGGFGHGLFAHDMLARLERVHRDEGVGLVRREHMDHVDGLVLEQLLVVGADLGAGNTVFGGGLHGTFLHDVTERDHFDIGQLFQAGHVLP